MFFKKKSLGQNFLRSKGAVNYIISASKITKGDLILEIGPGQGFLTEDLIKASENVLCIEKDDRLIEILKEKFREQIAKGWLKIIHDDILDFNIDSIKAWIPAYAGTTNDNSTRHPRVGGDPCLYKVVANIPYYITGQLIKKFLTAKNKPTSMTLMVQKEVAERITARDNKESILSLSVKLFGKPKYIKTVKKENFSPVPKVDSAILLIENIQDSAFERKDQEILFFEIIKKAFNQKRKKIRTTLKNYELFLKKLKINTNKRPEDLSIEDWTKFIKEIS